VTIIQWAQWHNVPSVRPAIKMSQVQQFHHAAELNSISKNLLFETETGMKMETGE